jgi:hypothetical protein
MDRILKLIREADHTNNLDLFAFHAPIISQQDINDHEKSVFKAIESLESESEKKKYINDFMKKCLICNLTTDAYYLYVFEKHPPKSSSKRFPILSK